MISELNDKGFEVDSSAIPDKIEELFEAYILQNQLASIADDHLDGVIFPIYPASKINNFEIISNISFSEGGKFIGNQSELPDKLLPPIFELFGTLVEYQENVSKSTNFDHKVYDALPSIFIDMAEKSRCDSGFCLLKRCTWHDMDSKAISLLNTEGKLF